MDTRYEVDASVRQEGGEGRSKTMRLWTKGTAGDQEYKVHIDFEAGQAFVDKVPVADVREASYGGWQIRMHGTETWRTEVSHNRLVAHVCRAVHENQS